MEAIFKKDVVLNKTACRVIGVGVFMTLTALGAFVRIPLPFTPVPLTMQTMFVLLAGAFLGSKLGAASQLGYILLGLSGLPIFTGAGSGMLYILGPTGGYLLGFVLAGLFIGRAVKLCPASPAAVFAVFCLADLVLLMSGALWLKFSLGLTMNKALLAGVVPFIAGDIIKAFTATLIYLKSRERIAEVF
ncbi:MAG: biotin transporter BioY [Candidatus Omnitrophota bacterium]